MSLLPATNPIRASIKTALNGEFPYDDLFIRSIETLTIGTGALTQNFAVVAAGERRPLIHTKIVVASGQFLSDATFTLQNANHVVGDLVTIEFIPGDFPAGRTLTVKDSAGLTLATATNASTSSPINFTLNSDNTWLVTDAIADVLPQDLSTTATPTFAAVNLQGAAGVGFVNLKAQSSDPAAPASNNIRLFANSANKFAWIGSSGFVRNFDGTLTASRSYTLPDANSSIPVFGQTITFAGPTAARTVTLPDAAFTVARTDSGNTFTGAQTIGGNITFGTSASVLNGTTGSIGLTATGTNQSITLTPSGTGVVNITTPSSGTQSMIQMSSAGANQISALIGNSNAQTFWGVTAGGAAYIAATSANGAIIFQPSNTEKARFAPTTGNLLLGGLTTDGTGVLQLPTHTTNTGGFNFGAGTASQLFTSSPGIFRASDGSTNAVLELNGSAGATTGFTFFQAGSSVGYLRYSGNTSMILGSGAATALTLDSSQNALFAAKATVTKPLITVPSVLTYASPTSVDVTLASTYTVTTVNATGSVTFNATAGGTAGQEMTILITNDATSAKAITFGTNFKSTGTLAASAASRQVTITFKSDGTNFLETGRAVLTT